MPILHGVTREGWGLPSPINLKNEDIMNTLEDIRELDGAKLDDDMRYYVTRNGITQYGYHAHFTGAYVCYTCGHVCDCGDNE